MMAEHWAEPQLCLMGVIDILICSMSPQAVAPF